MSLNILIVILILMIVPLTTTIYRNGIHRSVSNELMKRKLIALGLLSMLFIGFLPIIFYGLSLILIVPVLISIVILSIAFPLWNKGLKKALESRNGTTQQAKIKHESPEQMKVLYQSGLISKQEYLKKTKGANKL